MGSGDATYSIKTSIEAVCLTCKLKLWGEKQTYGKWTLVHASHFDGYHINCIPRLITAEDRLERIKDEYGVEITIEEEEEKGDDGG